MIVVELCSWSIKVAVMVEQVQTPKHLLLAATDKLQQPFGTDKAMLCDVPQYLQIALGELK